MAFLISSPKSGILTVLCTIKERYDACWGQRVCSLHRYDLDPAHHLAITGTCFFFFSFPSSLSVTALFWFRWCPDPTLKQTGQLSQSTILRQREKLHRFNAQFGSHSLFLRGKTTSSLQHGFHFYRFRLRFWIWKHFTHYSGRWDLRTKRSSGKQHKHKPLPQKRLLISLRCKGKPEPGGQPCNEEAHI